MFLCIALTNRCSFRCLTCLNSSDPRGEYGLSTKVLKETMDWLSRQKDPQVDFTGGEPFIRDDMYELIQYGKDHNITLNLCTNGWNIEEKDIPLLNNMRRVSVTFYGLKDFHDSITRVNGSYKKAMEVLSLLKDSQVRVRANVVTMARALHGLPELAYELQKAGANEIKFSMMLPQRRAREFISNLLTAKENNSLERSLRARDDLHVPLDFQRFDQKLFKCNIYEKERLFLTAEGMIYSCSAFLHTSYAIGSISGARSASESFEDLEWSDVLNSMKRIKENRCPALGLGIYTKHKDMLLHEGCPPFAERLGEKDES